MSKPYLVQRLQVRTFGADQRKGVDREFEMDYMGSAEFEFGSLPKSLREMRKLGDANQKSMFEISFGKTTHTVFYYGPSEHLEVAKDLFTDHLVCRYGKKYPLKERSEIQDAFFNNDETKNETVAWWDIDNNWIAFKSKKLRDKWINALNDK